MCHFAGRGIAILGWQGETRRSFSISNQIELKNEEWWRRSGSKGEGSEERPPRALPTAQPFKKIKTTRPAGRVYHRISGVVIMGRTKKSYKTMTKRTRYKLEALYNAGVPVKKIAEELGYSFQAIYHELKRGYYMHRNTDWTETKRYSADKAQLSAEINATAKGAPIKLDRDKEFADFVEDMILKGYSPGAILLYIKDHGLKFKTKVCRVTLYSYIDKGVFLKITNKNLLHKGKRKNKAEKESKRLAKNPKRKA